MSVLKRILGFPGLGLCPHAMHVVLCLPDLLLHLISGWRSWQGWAWGLRKEEGVLPGIEL